LRVNILIAGGIDSSSQHHSILFRNRGFYLRVRARKLNVIIGILIREQLDHNYGGPGGSGKLSIDRKGHSTNIYAIGFSERRWFLRNSARKLNSVCRSHPGRLGSNRGRPLRYHCGGITAFSLQEFLTQRRRAEIDEETFLTHRQQRPRVSSTKSNTSSCWATGFRSRLKIER